MKPEAATLLLKMSVGKGNRHVRLSNSCVIKMSMKWCRNISGSVGGWMLKQSPFFCTDSCTFLFREACKQKDTLGGLPISELAVPSKPLIRYASMLAQQLWMGGKKRERCEELAEKTADTGHVSCQKTPNTISTFKRTRQEGHRVWKAEIWVSRAGIDALLPLVVFNL